MSRLGKVLLIAFVAVVALVVNTTLLAGIVVYRASRAGTAVVRVEEKAPGGAHLWIPVPVGLVRTALYFVPQKDLPQLDPEAQRSLPVARRVAVELAKAPDGVLVEVRSDHEQVAISKRGDDLVIEVESPNEHVKVRVPALALDEILGDVARFPVRPAASPAEPTVI
jgi:hypothetical protein